MNQANTTNESNVLQTEDVIINGTTLSVAILQDIDPVAKTHVCIPLTTLQRIIKLANYKKASFDDIKSQFIQELRDDVHDMTDYVLTLDEELNFHRVVNLLAKATTEPKPQEVDNNIWPNVVGDITLAE